MRPYAVLPFKATVSCGVIFINQVNIAKPKEKQRKEESPRRGANRDIISALCFHYHLSLQANRSLTLV